MCTQRVLLVCAVASALFVGPVRAEEPASEARFEVLVVGTFHAPWQFRSRRFHPGHVRAALELAKPDVIGVESNPTWFAKDAFHSVTYEAQGIAVPWAKERAVPAYGVDWMDIAAWDERTGKHEREWAQRIRKALQSGREGAWTYGQLPGAALSKAKEYFETTAKETDFALINDIGTKSYGERWLEGAAKLTPFGGHRNNEIAKRCVEVMEDHPGKRLVVVIGAGHKAVLDEIFRRTPHVRLLEWETDVRAPTEEEAEAALTTTDRIVILGHNLDGERSYFHAELIDLERMESVLGGLDGAGEAQLVAAYFRARLAEHRGDLVEAARGLAALYERMTTADAERESDRTTALYAFPIHHWRMAYGLRQAARLEVARILRARGEREEAQALLVALASDMPEAEGAHGPEWRMTTLAKAFPLFLTRTDEPQAASSTVSATPVQRRWRAHDPGSGPLPIARDGEALRVHLAQAKGPGRPYIGRVFDLAQPGGTWVFTARVRADGVERVRLEAYVWPTPSKAETVGSLHLEASSGAWQDVRLELAVPADLASVGVNLYASRTADGTLWLRDAKLDPLR